MANNPISPIMTSAFEISLKFLVSNCNQPLLLKGKTNIERKRVFLSPLCRVINKHYRSLFILLSGYEPKLIPSYHRHLTSTVYH